MECFICSKRIEKGYLCKDHANKLYEKLKNREGKIESPTWKNHCSICGEHENRTIIEYPPHGYFCDKDIIEEWNRCK